MAPALPLAGPTPTTRRRRFPSAVRSLALVVVLALVAAAGILTAPARPADAATVGLLNCEFGKFQMFDVQWSINGGVLSVSGIQPPYSANPTPHALTVAPAPNPELLDTDYFKFVATSYVVPDPNPSGETAIGLEQYAADGTVKLRMDDWGVFQAYGPGFVFYLGEGSWGTVITTGQSLEYGSSAQLPVTRQASPGDVITEAEMLEYQCQGSPLPPPGAVSVTAPSPSMTAGDPTPSLVPTVEPVDGLSQDPTCAIYVPADTTFSQPVTITAESAAGDYVVHCSGAVLAEGYDTVVYVDGKLTVAAAPTPDTTTTTTAAPAPADDSALPSTGQDSTLPLMIAAVVLLCLGGGLVVLHRTRRPAMSPVYAFRTTEVLPGVDPFAYLSSVAAPAGIEAEPDVEVPVVDESVVEPAIEPVVPEELRLEAPVVDEIVLEEQASVVEELTVWPIAAEPIDEEPVTEASMVWPLVEELVPAPVVEAPVVEESVVEELVPAPVVEAPVVEEFVPAPAPRQTAAARRQAFLERSALERRLAMLEGRSDAHSIAWARSLRAKLNALGD